MLSLSVFLDVTAFKKSIAVFLVKIYEMKESRPDPFGGEGDYKAFIRKE